MHKNTFALILTLLAYSPVFGHESQTVAQSDATWEAIKVFEGNPSTVTGDFDCQGISVGMAQWNLGKSKESVRKIIMSIPRDQLGLVMPQFGERFTEALSGTRDEALGFVRSLQAIDRPDSCDANIRKALWTIEGKAFVMELSRALVTTQAFKTQRLLRTDIFSAGHRNAIEWARAARGPDATAAPREIAYFVDMQNFNGGGFAKFGVPSQPLSKIERTACLVKTITYLRTADEYFLLHKKAARKNATLLNPQSLSESDADLFCKSYRVAMKLSADHARQFRLTVINRRAAILFGSAYYSDRDTRPTRISFAPSK